MIAAGALLRLLWRWEVLWVLFPLFWAVAVPIMRLTDSGAPASALWTGGAAVAAAHAAAWQLAVLVSAVAGAAVALCRLPLQHARFAWTLPGARRGLLAGTLLVALPVCAALALLVDRSSGVPVAASAAAFAVALLCFAAAGVPMDAAFPRAARWLAGLMLVAAAFRPAELAGLAGAWPWAVALAALCVGIAILAAQHSERAARLRPFRASGAVSGPRRLYWAERRRDARGWTHALATERTGPWLRAVAYEGGAGRPPALRPAVAALVAVLFGHLMNDPVLILVIGAGFLLELRPGLGSGLLYPLSRAQRAELTVIGSAIAVSALVLLMACVAAALVAAGVPPLGWFADGTPSAGWAPVLGMAFAWAPVAQWAAVRWPDTDARLGAQLLSRAGMYLAFAVPAMLSARAVTGRSLGVLVLAVAAAAVVVWLGYRAAVLRHYARVDLAPHAARG